MNIEACTFYPAYKSQSNLSIFERNDLLLFCLQLRFNIDDIVSTGIASLTDGSDDKKIDLIYIDEDNKLVVIAQSYISDNINKKSAQSNKAADLNTGITWLLNQDIEKLPISLQSHAKELRHLLKEDQINSIYVWYHHNLPESINVSAELSTVSLTIKSALESNFPESHPTNIFSLEVGINKIEEWYQSIKNPILIDEKFLLDIPGGYELFDENWNGFVTSISADWLYKQYKQYGKDLFSANVREYLGSRKSDANINNGIKNTAENEPNNFWIYNNGLTALVHDYTLKKKGKKHNIEIQGLSIVNGAQTTGAIGSLKKPPASSAKIPTRFIKCNNPDLIHGIVKYNNSQNKINAPDFRSHDSIQRRLVDEFDEILDLEYSARRGGFEDKIKKKQNQLLSVTAGQAIASLNNDPEVAYHKKNKIWEDDSLYSKYFNDSTNAKNLLFAYSLLKTIGNLKLDLLKKSKVQDMTQSENDQLDFFRKRGSIQMFLSAVSKCLETFIDRPIPSLLQIHFNSINTLDEAIKIWIPIIETVKPFVNKLSDGLADGFRNTESVTSAIDNFSSLVESTKQPNKKTFSDFQKNVSIQ